MQKSDLKRFHVDPTNDLTTAKVCFPTGYPQKKNLKNTEFVSSSNKQEEHLSKLFGK